MKNTLKVSKIMLGGKKPSKEDENRERGNWSNRLEFILSCLSYAIGLGNIWRFPYLVYRNGGGAFLIPYFIMLFTAGLPLFFLELSFGQYASEGPITIWKISPLFQGLGYGMFLVSALVGIYYNMIIAWTLFYLYSSFRSSLPWSSCGNWWNSEACGRFDGTNCTALKGVMLNGTCILKENMTNITIQAETPKMASDEYFHEYMLSMSDGMHDLGSIKWQLALCLFIAWVLCYIALLKGVKSFGKVVYFTAFFPYLVLIILLIRAATLPGYMDGILFYVTPKWEMLTEARVWGDAAVQIFFSLAPCWGGLITLASYNPFHNNCYRDAVLVGIVNPLTSVFAGFVIFGVVGFMSHELGVPVDKVVEQGAGLAFIAYPEAVTRLPLSPMWAILFFLMLLTLGLGTQFTILETVVTTIVDEWPDTLRRLHKWVLALICLVMFALGLPLCSRGGMYLLQLMDAFCASYSTLLIGILEVTVISWIYGVDNFLKDIKDMLGHYPASYYYWKYSWKVVTPLILTFILLFNFVDFTPPKYANYVYPAWALAIGWMMTLISIIVIPGVAVYKICTQAKGPLWTRIKTLSKPTDSWGPKLRIHSAQTDRLRQIDSQVPLALNQHSIGIDEPETLLPVPYGDGQSPPSIRKLNGETTGV
uniref:Transporter n=1 Tax=Hemiscolopendra marginata TaxID=943146 RepID=A0A646QC04_9MYRI